MLSFIRKILQNKKQIERFKKRAGMSIEREKEIDLFFENNLDAQKELEEYMNPKKKSNSTKKVRCLTPYIQMKREEIYDKFNS